MEYFFFDFFDFLFFVFFFLCDFLFLQSFGFFYLIPLKKNADAANYASAKTPETAGASGKSAATTAGQKTSEKPKYYQVGFFKTKEYAENLAAELVAKGFPAQVKTETKNGSTAFYVIVNETGDSVSISDKLRNAGYECYPVFQDKASFTKYAADVEP